MSKQFISSSVLGQLLQDDRFEDWWNIDNVAVPFFSNKLLPVTFMDFVPNADETFIEEADEAIALFLDKGDADRLKVSEYILDNFLLIKKEVDEPYWDDELANITDARQIWEFVSPTGITVSRRPYLDRDIYIGISCECDWEPEHGLQLVFRKGKKLTRVSQIDGHLTDADAYDIPDADDRLLSEF